MEDLEGPENGGPEDRATTEKLADWTQVIYGAERRQNNGKVPVEGGRGWGMGSKLRQAITVQPQGDIKVTCVYFQILRSVYFPRATPSCLLACGHFDKPVISTLREIK